VADLLQLFLTTDFISSEAVLRQALVGLGKTDSSASAFLVGEAATEADDVLAALLLGVFSLLATLLVVCGQTHQLSYYRSF
jgi:hypothetical protein